MEKTASFTTLVVGRTECPWGTFNRFPLIFPAATRISISLGYYTMLLEMVSSDLRN
jgi:hypothetical protein